MRPQMQHLGTPAAPTLQRRSSYSQMLQARRLVQVKRTQDECATPSTAGCCQPLTQQHDPCLLQQSHTPAPEQQPSHPCRVPGVCRPDLCDHRDEIAVCSQGTVCSTEQLLQATLCWRLQRLMFQCSMSVSRSRSSTQCWCSLEPVQRMCGPCSPAGPHCSGQVASLTHAGTGRSAQGGCPQRPAPSPQ